jgi:L-glyceraldehyde 3-phosphate reductase
MSLDYVDIFYSHRFDPVTPIEETVAALDTLVRQGKALYVGISSYEPERTARRPRWRVSSARRCHPPAVLLDPRRWVEDGLTGVLREEGWGDRLHAARAGPAHRYLGDGTAARSQERSSLPGRRQPIRRWRACAR